MKSLIGSILVFSCSAFAVGFGPGDANDVVYGSWCAKNKVMTTDDRGRDILRLDCSKSRQKCEEFSIPKASIVWIAARCK